MKKLIVILAIVLNSGLLFATEQEPDYLYYNGRELFLATGWGHPSPLQTYFTQNNIKYPFTMLSTANYRGHVAIWEISDNRLFLKEVQIEEEKFKPEEFNIRSRSDSTSFKDKVFADWFTGVIIGKDFNDTNYWEVKKSYYFYIKHGVVTDIQGITKMDFIQIQQMTEKDTLHNELMAKYSMLHLNKNYISYYFRINGKDTIKVDSKGGYLSGNYGLSPVLSYYDNDHLKWPYNWENVEKSGAPFCTWIIENNRLLLTNIELHTGTGFYSIDKHSVNLIDLFPDKLIDHKVFGDWISGIFVIHHGKNEEDENLPGYFEFKASEFTYLRLKNGIVLEKYTIPADFDFKNMPETTEVGLKKILDELK